jgi:hypothetical protein
LKKVKWEMSIGFVNATKTGELKFEDNATDEGRKSC